VKIIEIFKLWGSILVSNDGANQAIDETDSKAQKTSKTFGEMIGSAAKMGAGIALAVGGAVLAVGGLAVSLTDDLQKSLNGVQASTGATDEAMIGMKDTMLEIYNDNFGDSLEDIGNVMGLVTQQTGLAGDALKRMTEGAFALRDTFEMDVAGSVETAGIMMKNFGIDSDQAYNLIVQGAQKGLNKQGDLLDVLKEYGPHFASLGFSAEEAMNMLVNGAEGGVFSVDQLGDVVHEFGRKMREEDLSKPLQQLGLDSVRYTTMVAQGGETAKKAFTEIAQKVGEIKDPVLQNQIGIGIFGDMMGEVGIKGVLAMSNTQGAISNTVDALGKINAVKYNTFGEAMEGIKRNLQTGLLLPLGEKIMPVMNTFASWISGNMPVIKNEIEFAMGVVGKVFDGIGNIISTYIMPQFNVFSSMIAENMPQIKAAIQAMYDYVKPSFDQLAEAIRINVLPMIQGFWNLVQSAMPTIRVLFEIAMIAVGTALKIAMEVISIFIGAVKGIYDFIEPKLELVIDIFNKVSSAIETALGWLLNWNNTSSKEKSVKVSSGSVGNNANGTDYWRGGDTWVGERGPEIVRLPRGSQVFSNRESMAMAGGVTVNINGANIMDDYGVDRLMDRVMDRLALKGVR